MEGPDGRTGAQDCAWSLQFGKQTFLENFRNFALPAARTKGHQFQGLAVAFVVRVKFNSTKRLQVGNSSVNDTQTERERGRG